MIVLNVDFNVSIINDCAFVYEDMLPYFLSNFNTKLIKHSRTLFGKTFQLLWKIVTAKANLYVANYALQDAWLTQKFKTLHILHCHGSDIRLALHCKKYGWAVKSNLKNANKVFYATEDLEPQIKEYREDAIYIPTPVRTDVFHPIPHKNGKLKAIYFAKSYEPFPEFLLQLCNKHEIRVDQLEPTYPHYDLPSVFGNYDIFIDRFTIPSHSKTCLEAMSCGLATITFKDKDDFEEKIFSFQNPELLHKTQLANYQFVRENHSAEKVANQILAHWREFTYEN
jgi:glycosyltransferase involved in cell wall biosynthesis